jgi:hypothetical protein
MLPSYRWRLIAYPQRDLGEPIIDLIDYNADPDESRNLAKANPDVVAELLEGAFNKPTEAVFMETNP